MSMNRVKTWWDTFIHTKINYDDYDDDDDDVIDSGDGVAGGNDDVYHFTATLLEQISTEESTCICWWKLWETVESFNAPTLVDLEQELFIQLQNNYFKSFLNHTASCQACDASSLECSTDWTISRGGTESEFHQKVHWILPQVCRLYWHYSWALVDKWLL